jgi:hypothetical protein
MTSAGVPRRGERQLGQSLLGSESAAADWQNWS